MIHPFSCMNDPLAVRELIKILNGKKYHATSSLKVMWQDLFSEEFRNYVRVYK